MQFENRLNKKRPDHNQNPNMDSSKILKIRNDAQNEKYDPNKKNTLQYLKTSTKPIETIQSINKKIEDTINAIKTTPASCRARRIQLLKRLVKLYEEQEKLELKEKQNRSNDNNDLSK